MSVQANTKRKVYERDDLHCTYCGTECVEWHRELGDDWRNVATIDHVIPRSRGGSNRVANLVTACFSCNSQKGNRTREEYLDWLARKRAEADAESVTGFIRRCLAEGLTLDATLGAAEVFEAGLRGS